MHNDIVDLIKADGTKIEGIKASVQDKKTFIQRSNILIEAGDLLQRKASNGSLITYEVIEPGFREKSVALPAHYQIKHKNLSIQEADKMVQNIFNFDSITANQVQLGNDNQLNATINIQKLVEAIAESDDHEAKSILKSLLENSTVASVVGAGVSGLIGII